MMFHGVIHLHGHDFFFKITLIFGSDCEQRNSGIGQHIDRLCFGLMVPEFIQNDHSHGLKNSMALKETHVTSNDVSNMLVTFHVGHFSATEECVTATF